MELAGGPITTPPEMEVTAPLEADSAFLARCCLTKLAMRLMMSSTAVCTFAIGLEGGGGRRAEGSASVRIGEARWARADDDRHGNEI